MAREETRAWKQSGGEEGREVTGLTDLIEDVDAERPPAPPRVCGPHAPLRAGSKHSPFLAHTNLEEAGPTLSSRLPCAEVQFSSLGWALGWLLAVPYPLPMGRLFFFFLIISFF